MENNNEYKMIVESIKLIACSFEEQKEVLPDFVDVKDEVLNTFFEGFIRLPLLVEVGKFTNREIAEILRLNNLIDITNTTIDEGDVDSFSKGAEWTKIRSKAKSLLEEMKVQPGLPDLSSFDWINPK